jgi:ABC-type glycerol-3-phosphate transport system substrate-binding protein
MAPKTKPSSDESAAKPGTTGGDTAARPDRRQRLVIAVAALAVLAACVAGAWWAVVAVSSAGDVAVDRTETLALRQAWQASHDAILPIAKDFTATTAGTIEVAAYSQRIAKARTIVDSINDVPVTVSDNGTIRDSMLSGASEVLDGMDALLAAASKNDTAGVDAAVTSIDEGSTALNEAGAALDAKIAAKGWR